LHFISPRTLVIYPRSISLSPTPLITMAPRGANAKKESGRSKKAENELKKKETAVAEKERKEAAKWEDGSKNDKSAEKEAKRQEQLARKAEAARLLAEEEASTPVKKATSNKTGNKKKGAKPAGPGALSAGGGLDAASPKETVEEEHQEVESFSATGIDNALDLLEVVNAKTDKASVGQQAAGIERHPERRFKAALEAYKEQELPKLKEEHRGLRRGQYEELLFKKFQKAPENPFNQTVVSYDATKGEKVDALKEKTAAMEQRLRD